jgi:hypothetical protein
VVRVQENLYYQEHGVINYSVPALFTSVNDSLSATVIDFSSRIVDPRGLVETGAAWKFTSPRARVFNIRALMQVSAVPASGSGFSTLTDVSASATAGKRQTGEEIVSGSGSWDYLVYAENTGSPPAVFGADADGRHTHRYINPGLFSTFTSPGHALTIKKNGVAVPDSDVFTQPAYVTAVVNQDLTVNAGPITVGWIETTIALDTNDSIQIEHSYNYSPVTISGLEYLTYNASGKAYIFITEVSKRT